MGNFVIQYTDTHCWFKSYRFVSLGSRMSSLHPERAMRLVLCSCLLAVRHCQRRSLPQIWCGGREELCYFLPAKMRWKSWKGAGCVLQTAAAGRGGGGGGGGGKPHRSRRIKGWPPSTPS
eukprot:1239349-Amphidinium_carterae.2